MSDEHTGVRDDVIASLEESLIENGALWDALAQGDRDQDVQIQLEHMLAILHSQVNLIGSLNGQIKEQRAALAEIAQRLDGFQESEDRQDTALTELDGAVADLEDRIHPPATEASDYIVRHLSSPNGWKTFPMDCQWLGISASPTDPNVLTVWGRITTANEENHGS